MAALSSRQWIAISGSIVLFAFLFLVNRIPPKVDTGQPPAGGHAVKNEDFNQILDEARAQVPAARQEAINRLEKTLSVAASDEQEKGIRQIIGMYDSAGAQVPATYYMEKLAGLKKSADLWYLSGERYYNASQLADKVEVRATLLQKASDCFNNSFKIDSTNLDTRVEIGKCLVESGNNPMQGIQTIEGVLKKDSNNKKGQLALGEFSIQSGQYAKAIYRFKRVLEIDPKYIEAYLYMEDTYEKMGDKENAIKSLEKYSTFVADKKIKDQVDAYIKKLKNDTIKNKQQ